jgi:soluble lytic murein transglycosylase
VRTVSRVGLVALCFALSGASEAPHAEASPEGNAAYAPAAVFALPNMQLPAASPEARCVAALAAGNPDVARRIAQSALAAAREPSLGRLRWLYAKATPEGADARVPLEALAKSTHPLASWARLRLTERLREKDPNAAVSAAEALLAEPEFRSRGEQLLALSLYGAGRIVEAEPLLRSLVAEAPERSAAVAWAMPLAAILGNKPDTASRKQALGLYRRVMTRAPLTASAELARMLAQRVLERLSPAERKALAQPTADEAFAEAQALLDGREYTRAAQAYSALSERFRGDPKSVCDAQLGQGKALASAKKPDALPLFEEVARNCHAPEWQASAHFQAGRVLLRRGDPTQAIVHYDTVARDCPTHRLTDDALLAAAGAFQDLGDQAAAIARLKLLISLAPHGDMLPDARFMLAWLQRSARDFDGAIAELSALIKSGIGETAEDIVGRASYWRARTLLDRGDRDAAQQAFVELIQSHPFSYYAQQALARLGDLDKAAAAKVIATLRDETKHEPVRLGARPELRSVGFARALELLRVGETAPAVEELEALGWFRANAEDDLYLLGASLLQEFGADAQATSLARRRVTRVMRQTPKGPALALWRVVFPRAFRPLIDDVARQANVPAAFVRAVAREESSFDPAVVSSANAYGLIQLIRPTARAVGKPLGLPSDPDSLKKPEVNLRIGTSFMRQLFDRYKQNPALVPSAYNAGSGATDRWLRERPNLELDEWIESIPYTETRRYTRRVLQSYGVYAWLDEGRIPALLKTLPRL